MPQIVMNTETMPPPLLPLLLLYPYVAKLSNQDQNHFLIGFDWRIRMEAVGGCADCLLRKIHTLFSERSPSMTTGVVMNDVLLL